MPFERGSPTGPHASGSCRHGGWSNKGTAAAVSRGRVSTLTTRWVMILTEGLSGPYTGLVAIIETIFIKVKT